ncbi:replication endonuclease [Enterovibrio sp. ZSDZ42]|uniref:Replication endonuclease n=1 Tax=Enterovibrio gelatinilyticus TaxID=2899819 RepID=A0ABT5QX01_9GAMM|nr:replication endonuclease [Enterovibrio sp. ZSDZ42]MDD1792543.1 replication endonuclease [Enterovibrio sp. ZSDZ42]
MSRFPTQVAQEGTAAALVAKEAARAWAAGELQPRKVDGLFVPQAPELREPEGMSIIERKLWEVNPADHEWRKQFFADLPDYLVRYFANRYIAVFNKKGLKAANEFLVKRMGGELQRRIHLVMNRYRKLPTVTRVTKLAGEYADNLKEADRAKAEGKVFIGPHQERLPLDLDAIKPRPKKEKLLAELERDELKEMAFQLANVTKEKMLVLVDSLPSGTPYAEVTETVYQSLAQFVCEQGILPPLNKKRPTIEDYECAILKITAETWWVNRLKKVRNVMREHLAIAMGQVSKNASAYCSWDCQNEYKAQQERNWDAINNMELFDAENEEVVPMKDMVLKSVANPAIRRMELMVRTRGCEDIATHLGLTGLFLTLTTPSKYHNTYKKGGFIPHWSGASPRDAQQYLNKTWAKIRAQLQRMEIRWFGVRVAEPHHDGTPHWHLLLWVKPEHAAEVRDMFITKAIEADKQELLPKRKFVGPLDYRPRCDVKEINPELGTATGYIAKYISKNIDGYAMDGEKDDETGKDVKDTAKAVCAWKSRWNIRQFQFFGGAPVTTYRELRRYANANKAEFGNYLAQQERSDLIRLLDESYPDDFIGPRLNAKSLETKTLFTRLLDTYVPKAESASVTDTLKAADSGSWEGYVMGQGGPFVARDELQIRNDYEVTPMGSIYGEAVSKIIGFVAEGHAVKTRTKVWEIRKKSDATAEALALSGDSVASRSSVNNCTHPVCVDINKQFAHLSGEGWEIGADALRAMTNGDGMSLSGSSIAIGEGRSIRIRHIFEKGLDDFGNEVITERPPQLVEVETPRPQTGAMQFKGTLSELVARVTNPQPEQKPTENSQPELSRIPPTYWDDNEWPLI